MGTGRIVFSFKLLPAGAELSIAWECDSLLVPDDGDGGKSYTLTQHLGWISEITALPDGYIFAKSVAEATVAAATTFYNWAYPVLEQNAEGLSLGKNTSLTITSTAILEILLIARLILAV